MNDLSRRFVDRDVRDRPGYKAVAEKYVREYTGEFEPVVEMQKYLQRGGDMTVGQIRTILNCMRQDPRVVMDVPVAVMESGVTPIRKKRQLGYETITLQCSNTNSHEPHSDTKHEPARDMMVNYKCPGVEYLINRQPTIYMGARVKVSFIRARSSGLIHKIATGNKGNQGFVEWAHRPRSYYREDFHEYGYGKPTLFVYTGCGKGSMNLQNPVLYKEMPDLKQLSQLTGLGARTCKRCFSSENG